MSRLQHRSSALYLHIWDIWGSSVILRGGCLHFFPPSNGPITQFFFPEIGSFLVLLGEMGHLFSRWAYPLLFVMWVSVIVMNFPPVWFPLVHIIQKFSKLLTHQWHHFPFSSTATHLTFFLHFILIGHRLCQEKLYFRSVQSSWVTISHMWLLNT